MASLEWPASLPSIKGRLIKTESSGSRSFRAGKRAYYSLGKRRDDIHFIYCAADEVNVFMDPDDIIELAPSSRIFQFGDLEFTIVSPTYSLTLKTSKDLLREWIMTLNAVVELFPLISTLTTHHLSRAHFHKPTWCAICKDFIWGLSFQGYECSTCGEPFHPKCLQALPANCQLKR